MGLERNTGLRSRFLQKDIPKIWCWLLLALLVVARMLIAWSQRVYLEPDSSSLDDMLMVRGAMSLVEGNWLGDYGSIAIAKSMGFSFWLALLHKLHIPLLLGNAGLWVAVCLFASRALRPFFTGNLSRLVLFAVLAFQPFSYDQYTMRAYRDAIFPSFCLLVFAGVVGYVLRLRQPGRKGALFACIGAGAGLGGAWLLREDAAVLLPFAIGGLGLAVLYLVLNKTLQKRLAKGLFALVPFGILGASILAFSYGNWLHYGFFGVNDLSNGSFPKAYGALVAVSEAESGYSIAEPVSQQSLAKIYAEVPSMALLQEELSPDKTLFKGFQSTLHEGEFSGSFYYALRIAAERAGQIPDGATAQLYWAQVKQEVDAAVAEGRLQSARPGATTVPRWNSSLLQPTLSSSGEYLLQVLTFSGQDPEPRESKGTAAKIPPITEFLHARVQSGYYADTVIPYRNPVQETVFVLCEILLWVYRVAVWPLLLYALYAMGRGMGRGVKQMVTQRRFPFLLLCSIVALGLLLSFLLRLGVAAYMDVAAFKIGYYAMYLAGGVPALLLFFAVGIGLPLPALALKKPPKEKPGGHKKA